MVESGQKIDRDDLRAGVVQGLLTEAQAAGLMQLAETRAGLRDHMTGLDEPFELFRGFNEIFIVVGLVILYAGWIGVTSLALFGAEEDGGTILLAALGAIASAALARYFTLKRRMVAPSITLTILFALSILQFGTGIAFQIEGGDYNFVVGLAASILTIALAGWYWVFRIPAAAGLTALGVFVTAFVLFTREEVLFLDPTQIFLLTADGPYAFLTIFLGLVTLCVAMAFDVSDPHRITRRANTGLWLHIIAAPAIVNTVALTLFTIDTVVSLIALVLFCAFIAVFAVVIDRRSFLISGVGYIVALSITVLETSAWAVVLALGGGLILLGAQWDRVRGAIMEALPGFPGKTRLPPWMRPTTLSKDLT